MNLFQFLASQGGLKRNGDLAAIFDGNPFVPGRGRLLRDTGMTLDEALTRAREAGYIFDPGDVSAQELRLAQRDLLDLLEREHRGERIYPQNSARGLEKSDAIAGSEDFARAQIRGDLEAELEAVGALRGTDARLLDAATELLMRGRESDPLLAIERAAMDDYYKGVADAERTISQPGAAGAGQGAERGLAPQDGAGAAGADSRGAAARGPADANGRQPEPAGADQGTKAGPEKIEVMDRVLVPEDGVLKSVSRVDYENRIAREKFFGEVVEACAS